MRHRPHHRCCATFAWVPGTLNYKYNPPRPVELLRHGQPYDFAKDLALLTQLPTAVTATVTERTAESGIFVPATEEGGGGTFDTPDAAFSMFNAAMPVSVGRLRFAAGASC